MSGNNSDSEDLGLSDLTMIKTSSKVEGDAEAEGIENKKDDSLKIIMDAAADLAAKRISLQSLDEEEETALQLEMLKHKLERKRKSREVAIAEARLRAMSEASGRLAYQPPSEFTPQAERRLGADKSTLEVEGPHSDHREEIAANAPPDIVLFTFHTENFITSPSLTTSPSIEPLNSILCSTFKFKSRL